MSAVRIALLGLGNVGKNFIGILDSSRKHLEEACGTTIEVAFAGDSKTIVSIPNGVSLQRLLKAKESGDISKVGKPVSLDDVLDSRIDALVDMSSASKDGIREKEIYLRAFEKGINVVTANKSPLALHWKSLVSEAEKRQLKLLYEATVAGGVPIFNFVRYSCGPSRVLRFRGIVSLTANFVVKMMHDGTSFDQAVRKAQEIGVAETDYTDDTSGLDAARKCVILVNSLFNRQLTLGEMKYSGIPEVSESDVRDHGANLRLITEIRENSGNLEMSTGFRRLDDDDYLMQLGEYSLGYEIETDNNGILRVSSGHDGPKETASGVMNDVLLLARDLRNP